ncbi:hypothetical protein [Pedobacter miscanthi]|uniref:Uncharacterized protein n=1 Tax=Pedobacter miscanthi TaxID=2259170 RepID=A0A366LCL1_9SPHI|nr:hypothetical protein [Pedobacter miscanthi]RBQ11520.1 hypothetical protein DRW42_03395 [Pedobacter miscanthi]
MNTMQFRTAILMACLILTGLSCKKKSDNPIDHLPPLSTTGANIFGCLVNGQAFLPKAAGVSGREPLNFSYGIANNKNYISISVESSGSKSSAYVQLFINATAFKQGDEYTFGSGPRLNDNPSAHYNYSGPKDSYGTDYNTNNQVNGKLHLIYFDGKIASGIFSFDAVNDAGEKVEIREGRFDLKLRNF